MAKNKFKKVYTVAQANDDPRVDEMFSEFGNIDSNKNDWWIYLKEGYICETSECGSIHEQTAKDCIDILNRYVTTEEQFYSRWPNHSWHQNKKS